MNTRLWIGVVVWEGGWGWSGHSMEKRLVVLPCEKDIALWQMTLIVTLACLSVFAMVEETRLIDNHGCWWFPSVLKAVAVDGHEEASVDVETTAELQNHIFVLIDDSPILSIGVRNPIIVAAEVSRFVIRSMTPIGGDRVEKQISLCNWMWISQVRNQSVFDISDAQQRSMHRSWIRREGLLDDQVVVLDQWQQAKIWQWTYRGQQRSSINYLSQRFLSNETESDGQGLNVYLNSCESYLEIFAHQRLINVFQYVLFPPRHGRFDGTEDLRVSMRARQRERVNRATIRSQRLRRMITTLPFD